MNRVSSNQKQSREHSTGTANGHSLEELVVRAQKGDVGAFQELYGRYGRKIFNYVYRLTGSREEAEDLTQDTFILAFQNIGTLREAEKFQSWLYRIAQNTVFQRYRKKTPKLQSIDDEDQTEAQGLADLARAPDQDLLSDELEAVIQDAIESLPEKYKTVFVLSAVQRISYKEISGIVGRSLASVKSDIHRARVEVRNRVREYLEKQDGM